MSKIEEVVEWFYRMEKEKRDEYARRVINWIADSVRKIMKEKNVLKKKELFEEFMGKVEEKQDTLVVVLLYVIKPEFREDIVKILSSFGKRV